MTATGHRRKGTAITLARRTAQAVPWVMVAVQTWLWQWLISKHGETLLEQDHLRDKLVQAEQAVATLTAGGSGAWGVTPSVPPRMEDAQIPAPSSSSVQGDSARTAPYAHYHRLQDAAIKGVPPYPNQRFSGAGIVILAGGPQHYTNAWVLLTMLRRVLGCQLPIQVWYLGPHEMSPQMIELLQRFDVECIDTGAFQNRHPAHVFGGWECKSYAVLNCSFKDVILLDADNVPLIDPATLLSTPEYLATGALFWPDRHNIEPERPIWDICRVPRRSEPEFESGQLVIDKERCWDALHLALHMNEHSSFYYHHLHGDKDTFHMAWRMLDQPYSMPLHRPRQTIGTIRPNDREVANVLQQHDFAGNVIFHHRTGAKWTAWGDNFEMPGFEHEAVCQEALRELRQLWDGQVDLTLEFAKAPALVAEILRVRYFLYRRVGSDERVIALLPGRKIGDGRDWKEEVWRLDNEQDHPTLVIGGRAGTTCRLRRDDDGVWRGRWLFHERMPVELHPLGSGASA